MLIPALIFVVVSSGGAIVCSRWLPDLAPGPVASLAFFVVCGLIGAAVGLLAMHIYLIVTELDHLTGNAGLTQGEVVAAGIRDIAFEVGSLLAFTSIVYLLAPAPESDEETQREPQIEPSV